MIFRITFVILFFLLTLESFYIYISSPSYPDFTEPPLIEVICGEHCQYAIAKFDMKKLGGQSSVIFSNIDWDHKLIEISQYESWNPMTKQIVNRSFHIFYSSEWETGDFKVCLKSDDQKEIHLGTLLVFSNPQGESLEWVPAKTEMWAFEGK